MKLVSVNDAADHLARTPRTVRNLISRGLITGYKFPGVRGTRVDLDEINAKLQAVPAVRAEVNRQPFGPQAKIVYASSTPEAYEAAHDATPESEAS